VVAPYGHPSGAVAPSIPSELIPQHVAIVMDGNGRWANQRGLPRIEGHKAGEPALLDVMAGAIELGIKYVSVYAFSTENWRRSPEEVRFLMDLTRTYYVGSAISSTNGESGSVGRGAALACGAR
jgi:undecaprenyl diphosphate synthase